MGEGDKDSLPGAVGSDVVASNAFADGCDGDVAEARGDFDGYEVCGNARCGNGFCGIDDGVVVGEASKFGELRA